MMSLCTHRNPLSCLNDIRRNRLKKNQIDVNPLQLRACLRQGPPVSGTRHSGFIAFSTWLYWTPLPPTTPTKLQYSFEFSLTYGVVRKLKSITKKMDHVRLVQLSCHTCGMISARACQRWRRSTTLSRPVKDVVSVLGPATEVSFKVASFLICCASWG